MQKNPGSSWFYSEIVWCQVPSIIFMLLCQKESSNYHKYMIIQVYVSWVINHFKKNYESMNHKSSLSWSILSPGTSGGGHFPSLPGSCNDWQLKPSSPPKDSQEFSAKIELFEAFLPESTRTFNIQNLWRISNQLCRVPQLVIAEDKDVEKRWEKPGPFEKQRSCVTFWMWHCVTIVVWLPWIQSS